MHEEGPASAGKSGWLAQEHEKWELENYGRRQIVWKGLSGVGSARTPWFRCSLFRKPGGPHLCWRIYYWWVTERTTSPFKVLWYAVVSIYTLVRSRLSGNTFARLLLFCIVDILISISSSTTQLVCPKLRDGNHHKLSLMPS